MASNGFGFQPYPQRPSLPRKAVGAALMQQGQQQMEASDEATLGVPDDEMEGMEDEQPVVDDEPYLPRGADSAISAAMREAEDRLRRGGLQRGQQGQPGATMNAEQLRRLGLSQTEISLLQKSGGSR